MRRFTFLKNAMIMTVTALLLRTMGIMFRVYMSNKIGAEGMGLYQLIFSIYILFTAFATSGITIAVTRVIADEIACGTQKSVIRILQKVLFFCIVLGLAVGAALFFGSELICRFWLKDMRAVPAFQILAPSLPFMAVSNALRGYFIARRHVSRSSTSQIIEQCVRIGIVVVLLGKFLPYGLTWACAAVVCGNTLSEIVSCIYMYTGYLRDRKKILSAKHPQKRSYRVVTKLLSIAAPLAASSYLNTILRTIENVLVPDCLTKYTHSKEISLAQFGMLKGMAMPILFFPSSFLSALSTLLVPEISEAKALNQKKNLHRTIGYALHITFIMSILISAVFLMFPRELGLLIYHSEEIGFMIKVLAPIMPFMYLENVVLGILQGLNQQVSSLKYSITDSVVRILIILLLVPARGMEGFLFVMIVSNLLTAFLNIHRLLIITNVKIQWSKWIIKPLMSITAAALFSLFIIKKILFGYLNQFTYILCGILFVSVIYLLLLLFCKSVEREDLQLLKRK